jgi:hypothetical protein
MSRDYEISGEAVSNLIRKYKILPAERLFTPINDFLIILSAISHASSLMVGGTTHSVPWPGMRLNALRMGYAFAIPLRGPLELALEEKTPGFIEIGILPDDRVPLKNAKLKTRGLTQVMNHLITPIYLMFFERYNRWLKQTYGYDGINWPPTLNFARVVRNAAAHGKIKIDNKKAGPVTWRGLSYDHTNDGRTIIGTDLGVGDILGLMFEIDEELKKINAPVL